MARGTALLKSRPYGSERVERLVLITCTDDDGLSALQAVEVLYHRPAKLFGGDIEQYKKPIVRTARNGCRKIGLEVCTNDYVLHRVNLGQFDHFIYGRLNAIGVLATCRSEVRLTATATLHQFGCFAHQIASVLASLDEVVAEGNGE